VDLRFYFKYDSPQVFIAEFFELVGGAAGRFSQWLSAAPVNYGDATKSILFLRRRANE
jgi:hypothetical protein